MNWFGGFLPGTDFQSSAKPAPAAKRKNAASAQLASATSGNQTFDRGAWLKWRPFYVGATGDDQPSGLELEAMARGLTHGQHIDECMARLTVIQELIGYYGKKLPLKQAERKYLAVGGKLEKFKIFANGWHGDFQGTDKDIFHGDPVTGKEEPWPADYENAGEGRPYREFL